MEAIKIPVWGIESQCGYKPITTFWQDFSIADNFGVKAVKDTYKRAFSEWKTNYKYLTELVMVLNWKIMRKARTITTIFRLRSLCFLKASPISLVFPFISSLLFAI